ncbi:MAG TPA: acyl-ACP--UDP-N-acetylglucosamine O-acyltransferase [Myxococcales bacterium]|jgi:UDP-N-acetylglucosamine acyltransferase|nr:acyl-ACP--UDP-N-acetylglucosamine O-acyltransferase [Myxococcales bacterium]
MAIHSTAVVDRHAELDGSVEVGPYVVIGPKVKIGARTRVGPHAVIEGDTTIGQGNVIFQFASVGAIPQDLKYAGEATRLEIGDGNQIREFATVHIGTAGGGGVTRVANRCLLMANSHVAHDVQLGDGCILANSVALAGHVVVEDHVIFGGLAAVHQFTRIGRLVFVSGGAMVTQDVPPYLTVQGDRAEVVGINAVGLTRARFDEHAQARVKAAYKIVFRSKMGLREAVAHVKAEYGGNPEIDHFVAFLEGTQRGIAR